MIFSKELLKAFQSAAMENAEALHQEADTLLSKQHYARAYFLAVASIEETGKAALAFNALGRKLKNQAVQSRLNVEFQDHSVKIAAAFVALCKGLTQADLRKNLQHIVDLQVSLINGREPSMYVGIDETGTLQAPNRVISCTAATDCVRLARDCQSQTKMMLGSDQPYAFSESQDRLFALGKKAHKVWEEPNFHNYALHIIENEDFNTDTLQNAVVSYYDEYISKGRKWAPPGA